MDILNQQKVDDLAREIGEENVPVLLDIFLGELSTYIETLADNGSADSESHLAEISHALKSSAASFGADHLCALAVDIDSRVKLDQQIDVSVDTINMVAVLQSTRTEYLGLVGRW